MSRPYDEGNASVCVLGAVRSSIRSTERADKFSRISWRDSSLEVTKGESGVTLPREELAAKRLYPAPPAGP